MAYRFNRKYTAYAGINLAFSFGEVPIQTIALPGRAIQEENKIFSQSIFGIISGFEYLLSKRFSFNIEYTYGLKNFIPSGQYSGTKQRIVMGINYRF
ncbi:MAG: outer membrane beta-barrel protein [Proteobacteria bacterium]|nr:outer membrane beta-barrel protein [Pseudomonadota bacterium]